MSEHQPSKFSIYWSRRRMWIAVTWSVMVMALAVSYYFFIFLPAQDAAQVEAVKADTAMRERIEQAKLEQAKSFNDAESRAKSDERARLEACYQGVENNYQALWTQECLDRGGDKNCRLPTAASDSLDAYYRDQRDSCLKSYPQT
jgi:hypothetical protein